MGLDELTGQRLLGVNVLEPMAESHARHLSPKRAFPLSGALLLRFERTALICASPLRYMRNQVGTLVGLKSGDTVSLGYRVTVCPAEDVCNVLPARFGLPWSDGHWCTWSASADPAIGSVLNQVGLAAEATNGASPVWGIELEFQDSAVMRIQYRQEIDGSIERDVPGQHLALDQIYVVGPDQEFGWLHPAAPLDFFLGERWRSAKVADWPLALRKVLQSCAEPEAFYAQTLQRALVARFTQWPQYRQRLLALSLPVEVKDVPLKVLDGVFAACRPLQAGLLG